MILYHGTNVDFNKIDISKCLPYKDFGCGFYLVLNFSEVSVEWAQFIYKNRNRQLHFHHRYDVVIGPVADDGVAFLMSQFQHGYINEVTFAEQLRYKQLSSQYCFLTQKAIKTLKRL